LSRGEAPAATATPQVRFQPYVSLQATYDTALANTGVSSGGQIAHASATGLRLGWGLTGAHSWAHSRLGMSYHGSLSHYPSSSTFDTMDHSMLIGFTQNLSRHTTLALGESAGMFSRDFGLKGLPQSVPFDPNTLFLPTTDYFDNRTYFVSSQADLTVQTSARTSFNFGGGNYVTIRRSAALSNSTNELARADMQHRLTRRVTLGAAYSFMHFSHERPHGETDVHSVGPTLAIRVNRWFELTSLIGATRVESKFVQQAAVDPVITAVLGITSVQQLVYRVDYLKVPTFMARASRAVRNGYVYATGGHSVTPGNGLFETSYAYSMTGGYTYTGLRRWSANAQAAYSDAQAIGTVSGNYSTFSGALSIARKIFGTVSFSASLSARQYSSRDYKGYDRFIYTGYAGLTWAPGNAPVRLW
jgi:hypothetical protein